MLRRIMIFFCGLIVMASECLAYSSRGRVFREDFDDSYVTISGKEVLNGIAFWLMLFVVWYIVSVGGSFIKKFYNENLRKKK